MAPLPQNNTPRLFVEYTTGGQEHTMELRLPALGTSGDAIAMYANVVPAMTPLLHTSDAVTGARFSAANSNLSFPLAVVAEAGENATAADPDRKPAFVSATGRSLDGRRVRVTFFSQYIDTDGLGFRDVTPSDSLLVWYTAVTEGTTNARTISGAVPVWNSYINLGLNAYYQRKARRT